jgi:hypothetical protein
MNATLETLKKKTGAIAPLDKAAPRTSTAVAVPDNRPYVARYLDDLAPSSTVGRILKFSKDGRFVTADDDSPISEEDDYIALCDETQIGWIKFNGIGEAPTKVLGLLYDNFVMPARETLGDLDETQWEDGLSGQPQDPWLHQVSLVLQNEATQELFTYTTTSNTGRRAVGNLLKHYDRMKRSDANDLPIIKLRVGGFQHKDSRVGFVKTPSFVVVGRTSRDNAPRSSSGFLDDAIPF